MIQIVFLGTLTVQFFDWEVLGCYKRVGVDDFLKETLLKAHILTAKMTMGHVTHAVLKVAMSHK